MQHQRRAVSSRGGEHGEAKLAGQDPDSKIDKSTGPCAKQALRAQSFEGDPVSAWSRTHLWL